MRWALLDSDYHVFLSIRFNVRLVLEANAGRESANAGRESNIPSYKWVLMCNCTDFQKDSKMLREKHPEMQQGPAWGITTRCTRLETGKFFGQRDLRSREAFAESGHYVKNAQMRSCKA
jgi:hypothetical protein